MGVKNRAPFLLCVHVYIFVNACTCIPMYGGQRLALGILVVF